MCTKASTGISVLILNAFSSMEGEGVSAYAKTRPMGLADADITLSLPTRFA